MYVIKYMVRIQQLSLVTGLYETVREVEHETMSHYIDAAWGILCGVYNLQPGETAFSVGGRTYAVPTRTYKRSTLKFSIWFQSFEAAAEFRRALLYIILYALHIEGAVWQEQGERVCDVTMYLPDLAEYWLANSIPLSDWS